MPSPTKSAREVTHRRYPEPPVRYEGYSDLHFATEEQIQSWVALGGYDRGELSLSRGRVVFRGMHALVDCPEVSHAQLVGKKFPWAILVGVLFAAAIAVYVTSPVPLTWRQPLPYILAGILLVACIRQGRERWVEISYVEDGMPRRAYFRRSPLFGSSAARTHQLLREIETEVLGTTPEG